MAELAAARQLPHELTAPPSALLQRGDFACFSGQSAAAFLESVCGLVRHRGLQGLRTVYVVSGAKKAAFEAAFAGATSANLRYAGCTLTLVACTAF